MGKTFKEGVPKDKDIDKPPPKKRGVPVRRPGTTRKKPTRIDRMIEVPCEQCPHCGSGHLEPTGDSQDHLQENIVLPKVGRDLFSSSSL